MSRYTFSAGPDQECWHEPISRMNFRAAQHLYGGDWELVVTDLADQYHSDHDGWEASWPLQIRIYDGDSEVARFSVEREYEPVFTAWEVAKATPAVSQAQDGNAAAEPRSLLKNPHTEKETG